MENTKTIRLVRDDDSFILTGKMNCQGTLVSLTINCERFSSIKNIIHQIDIKSNEELVNVFLNLSNCMFWDLIQLQEDKIKLTDLVCQLIEESKTLVPIGMTSEEILAAFSIKD